MNVDPLQAKVTRVVRRIRAQRAIDSSVLGGVSGATVGAGLLLWSKLSHVDKLVWVLLAAIVAPLLAALFGALRPLPQLWAAQLIDRSHDLHDRFASALTFAQHSQADATAFEAACIRDALQHANRVEPKRAAPFHRPPWLLAWLMSLSTIGAIGLIETPTHAATPIAPTLRPALLAADDLDAFRKEAQDLRERALSPDLEQSVHELNQLLEQLANREVDREQALRTLRTLEEKLARASQAHPTALKDALGTLGRSLDRANITKTLAKALNQTDPAAAAEEAQRVAKQVRDGAVTKRDREAMRAALARAAKAHEGQTAAQLQQRREELQRLLQREREKRESSESERRLLNRRQRELERLQREEQSAGEQERQLERLQRELDQTAESLSQDQNEQAADALDRGAEELNRMAREQTTEQQRQQMRQQLQQLREMLRRQQQQQQSGNQGKQKQQGQGGGGQRLRLDQFTKLAQGQQQQGQGKDGQQQGQGQQGQAPGDGTKVLTLGQDGQGQPVTLEIPGMGHKTVTQQSGSGGRDPGTTPGGNNTGAATDIDSDHVNTRVEGEQQAGPTRSQIIEGASSDGFAARGYEKVFIDYERHAESVIERDEIPGGYRFYVRRYFQLIRPREPSP